MARRLIVTLFVVSSLAFAGSVRAQSGAGGSGSGGAGSSTPVEKGQWSRVQDVDANAGKITVDGQKTPLTVDKSTRLTRNGTEASLSDVKPGDEVRASYLHGKDEGPITQLDVRSKKHGNKAASQGSSASQGTGSSQGAPTSEDTGTSPSTGTSQQGTGTSQPGSTSK